MTDQTSKSIEQTSAHFVSHAKSLQRKRYRSDRRFKFLGLAAVLVACSFLVLLLSTIVGKGIGAFTHHYINLPLEFTGSVEKNSPQGGDYNLVYKKGIAALLPFVEGRKDKRTARNLVSGGAGIELYHQVINDPTMLSNAKSTWLPLDDYADLYLKGMVAENQKYEISGKVSVSVSGEMTTFASENRADFDTIILRLKQDLSLQTIRLRRKLERKKTEKELRLKSVNEGSEQQISNLDVEISSLVFLIGDVTERLRDIERGELLDDKTPSILAKAQGGIVRVTSISRGQISGELIVPFSAKHSAKLNTIELLYIATPQATRKFSDYQVSLIENLKSRGLIERKFNRIFFTRGASREPEQAGIWGALKGSLFTMVVTLLLAFPLGVGAAIYLEEFSAKNYLTDIIEVNINNLAAVPSIIFGLLGLAVFLNWFEMPRSAPLVGGLVLALMTLPTIIIASRAAIRAVPPSIREAALGIGASRVQMVFHHVLPLSMPGILTGTIIGMAQALGETAPLLMIGMVAFIVDIPETFSDPATVLPVQIFMWADFPEPAFQQKTAAAILVLLGFLIAMNTIAVLLRRKFERRW